MLKSGDPAIVVKVAFGGLHRKCPDDFSIDIDTSAKVYGAGDKQAVAENQSRSAKYRVKQSDIGKQLECTDDTTGVQPHTHHKRTDPTLSTYGVFYADTPADTIRQAVRNWLRAAARQLNSPLIETRYQDIDAAVARMSFA